MNSLSYIILSKEDSIYGTTYILWKRAFDLFYDLKNFISRNAKYIYIWLF